MSFIALHGAIRGAAHKACGTMCQDAAISWVSEDGTVVVGAVADGHGDPICIRSDIGSGLAADVAIQSLRNLSGCSFEECRQTGGRVAEAIVSQWVGLVSEDLQNYPIGEDELEGLDANVINYWLRTSPTHLYGTTLVAFLVTPSMCFIVQQGDGCCAVLLPDGRIWNPVPPDDRCTGNVTLCQEVSDDLTALSPKALKTTLFHPVYAHFGERIPREEALKELGLEDGKKNLLFFGLIRDYKGLDILLEAFGKLDDSYNLIVAGEPYGSFSKYEAIINSSPAKDRIKLFTRYIKDSEVKYFFSASDLAVLPYRSATQSGISAISWHFEVPMVVTDVGGLKQSIGDSGTGLVAEKPDPDLVAAEIKRFFSDKNIQTLCVNSIKAEKERLSWKTFAKKLLEFSDNLYKLI